MKQAIRRTAGAAPAEDERTRSRLLEAGARVFAAHGFRRATVREIVAKAGANVAAVNYHFGDKQGLYLASLRHWLGVGHSVFPADMGLADAAAGGVAPNPEQRLRAFVRSLLHRLLSDGPTAWAGRLMGWEMVEPTEAAGEVIGEVMRPMARLIESIVRDLIGPAAAADEQVVRFCACSVVGQCLFYRHAEPVIGRVFPGHRVTPELIEQLAGHVTRMCLAGFREYGADAAAGRRADRARRGGK